MNNLAEIPASHTNVGEGIKKRGLRTHIPVVS